MTSLRATSKKASKRIASHGPRHPWNSARLQRAHCSRPPQAHTGSSHRRRREQGGRRAGHSPALTVAEVGHGIYRANTPEIRKRRRAFLDELKATIPAHSITEATAENIA